MEQTFASDAQQQLRASRRYELEDRDRELNTLAKIGNAATCISAHVQLQHDVQNE